MKIIVTILSFILFAWLGFLFDKWIYHLIVDTMPAGDWTHFFKVVIGIVIAFFTIGTIIAISIGLAAFVNVIFQSFESSKRLKATRARVGKSQDDWKTKHNL